MKGCPICGRTYVDESISFCLDDGTLLSARYDPNVTLRPPTPQTQAAPTEVLHAQPTRSESIAQGRRPILSYVVIAIAALSVGVGIMLWLRPLSRDSASGSATSNEKTTQSDAAASAPTPTSEKSTSSNPDMQPNVGVAPINISGRWRNQFGQVSSITQQGGTFQFTAAGVACRGAFRSTGSGTIKGQDVELNYRSNYSTGRCQGTVTNDGRTIRSSCYDTACHQYAPISQRTGE